MWKGKRWGWYLGSFYYLYSVVLNANALITVPILMRSMSAQDIADMSRTPSYYVVKHSVRLVVHFLLYLYFFRMNVREFFSLSNDPKWKPVLAEAAICVSIVLIVNVLIRIMN